RDVAAGGGGGAARAARGALPRGVRLAAGALAGGGGALRGGPGRLDAGGGGVKSTVFLVNPAAGSGKAVDVWQTLLDSHPELRAATLVQDADRAVAAGLLAGALGEEVRS